MSPGAKVDHVLVLQGPQGIGKSRALRALVPDPSWFTDEIGYDLGKDSAERLRGKWIIELSELDALSKAEATRIKAFLTREADRYRPAYARHARDFPRQCVFAGTTNVDTFIRDPTGGRRFWPTRVGRIDVSSLVAVRDQLWAEALVRYERGEGWHLTPAVEAIASEEQGQRMQVDPWAEQLAPWLMTQNEVTIETCLAHLNVAGERRTQTDANRVAVVLQGAGFVRRQLRREGKQVWLYLRTSPVTSQGVSSEISEETVSDF